MAGLMATPCEFRFVQSVSARVKVVFLGVEHFSFGFDCAQRRLAERGECSKVDLVRASASEVREAIRDAHVVVPFMERVTADVVASAPELRLVVQYGVGLENVDWPACSRSGVCVSNVPAEGSGNATATAEHALFLTLAALRGGPRRLESIFNKRVLGGDAPVAQLDGKNALIVGYGAVGRRLAALLFALGANVAAAHAHRDWTQADGGGDASFLKERLSPRDLRRGLAIADVVVLACPLTPETRGLFDADLCDHCKPGACLVNVGRGPLAVRDAVLAALDSGRLAFFASDVGCIHDYVDGHHQRPSEPWDPHDALARHPNAYFTPHVGGYSDAAYAAMADAIIDAALCIHQGRPPPIWLNKPH